MTDQYTMCQQGILQIQGLIKAADKNIKAVTQYIEANGLTAHLSQGEQVTIIGVVGDKSRLSTENIALLADVDRIVPVTESYKLANLKFHPEPSVVKVGCTSIGPNTRTIMAGPCAVESNDQLMLIAEAVKKNGATILRGGFDERRIEQGIGQGLPRSLTREWCDVRACSRV